MLKLFSFFFICILAGCGNSISQIEDTGAQNECAEQTQQLQSTNQNQQKSEPELTLIMERYTWTHTLFYKVEIQPDGKVNFTKTNGRFISTKIIEKAESNLEKEKMKQLLTEIKTSDFFSLDSGYAYRFKNCPSALTHNDSVKIYIKLNGQEKTIDHDLGCFDLSFAELKKEIKKKEINLKDRIFPQKLYKLENKIDEIVETKRWLGERK